LSWSKLILGLFLANCPIFGSDDFRCIVHWLSDSLHTAEWHPNHHRTNQLFNEFVAMFKSINSSNYNSDLPVDRYVFSCCPWKYHSARHGQLDWTCFTSLTNTMAIDAPPNPQVSTDTESSLNQYNNAFISYFLWICF
jgi:hypothetical protein